MAYSQKISHYALTFISMTFLLGSLSSWGMVDAHVAMWNPGMYCMYGPNGQGPAKNTHNAAPVAPVYQESQEDWWFQHDRGCDKSPPPAGQFLELPAGGKAMVELTTNIDFTQFADNPQNWTYTAGNSMPDTPGVCNPTGVNIHCDTFANAAGTALAISYVSEIDQVTMENLVVFSVEANSPWMHWAIYEVPVHLPPCPPGGCICVWVSNFFYPFSQNHDVMNLIRSNIYFYRTIGMGSPCMRYRQHIFPRA